MKLSLFTDTWADTNGVSRFIKGVAEHADQDGRDLRVLTSTRRDSPRPLRNVDNYAPHVSRPYRKYPDLEFVVPPAFSMIRDTVRRRPDAIHVSTPGPVGLLGVFTAAACNIPLTGVYHTDFPAYIRDLYGERFFGKLADGYTRTFYRKFRVLFSRSPQYLQVLQRLGLSGDALFSLPAGLDLEQFNPGWRRDGFWAEMGLDPDRPKALYVGRVSIEKNLGFLADAWDGAVARGAEADLVIVGDGPYKDDLAKRLPEASFLGKRFGNELSRIYANSDLFVFPSVTDTLGQVVMEAHASGVPALVSDQGGPQLTVADGQTGHVLPVDAPAWSNAIVDLLDQPGHRQVLGQNAHERMQARGFAASFDAWWNLQCQAVNGQ